MSILEAECKLIFNTMTRLNHENRVDVTESRCPSGMCMKTYTYMRRIQTRNRAELLLLVAKRAREEAMKAQDTRVTKDSIDDNSQLFN